MKIVCNQKLLANSINIVQKAVSNKTTLPILKGILIEARDNTLKLIGNNLEIGIEHVIDEDVTIINEGSIVIPARLFGEIIRKLPDEDVEIEVHDNNEIIISCLNSKFNLLGYDAGEFTELPVLVESNSYTVNQDLIHNMIRQTIFATSVDESRLVLTGALLEIKDNSISMVAIDGYRLALRKAYINSNTHNKAVIPSKTLNELNKILSMEAEGDIVISFTEKHILFKMNKVKIVSRLLDGEFINYQQIIPKNSKTVVKVKTRALYEAIERASLLAKEGKNNMVKFSIEDEYMTIDSNVEIGSVTEKVSIELEGDDLEIGFNSKYLLDALKIIDSEEVDIDLSTSVSPCIIKPSDNTNYIYLVLPVRLAK